jgi:hypothetical protein
MKLSSSPWLVMVVAVVANLASTTEAVEHQPMLRTSSSTSSTATATLSNPTDTTSACHSQKDKAACFGTMDESTGTTCEWCECAAIPSECLTQEEAKLAPPGVFLCSTPGRSSDPEEDEEKEHIHHEQGKDGMYIFSDYHAKFTSDIVAENNDDFCDASSKSLSGYFEVAGSKYDDNGENKNYFFWMFEKRGATVEQVQEGTIPFVVWLTGGPGCSSTLALLTENGPCKVNDDGKTTSVNPYSWTEAAHVLWLDQPAGVGFSYGTESDSNEAMISEDAYYFLQSFFQTHSEYASSPLYVIGESYGTTENACVLYEPIWSFFLFLFFLFLRPLTPFSFF